jgi:hypothetical protein
VRSSPEPTPPVAGTPTPTNGHGSPLPASSTDERDELALSLRKATARSLGDLIDPSVGVFVRHNKTGCCPPLDHVTKWPQGELDWSEYLDEPSLIAALSDVSQLPGARKALANDDLICEEIAGSCERASWRCSDDMGCEPSARYLDLCGNTPMDVWAATIGGDNPTTGGPWLAVELLRESSMLETLWEAPRSTHDAFRVAVERVRFEIGIDGVKLYFGRSESGWVLVAIDLYEPDCG